MVSSEVVASAPAPPPSPISEPENTTLPPPSENQLSLSHPSHHKTSSRSLNPSFIPPLKPSNLFLTPEPIKRPSLKRSRSSPTLSPPLTTNSNPFSASIALPDPSLFHPPNPSQTISLTVSPSTLLLNSSSSFSRGPSIPS